ncbi:MAG: Ig-like domain-containing protein [Actinomycetota bacterium]
MRIKSRWGSSGLRLRAVVAGGATLLTVAGMAVANATASTTIDLPSDGAVHFRGEVLVQGHAEPGATVTVWELGEPLDAAVADNTGVWSRTISFSAGDRVIVAKTSASDPNPSGPRAFKVDLSKPAPIVTSPVEGAQLPEKDVRFSGSGVRGATVSVRENGGPELCGAHVLVSGNWSCSRLLGAGDHAVTVLQTDEGGTPGNPILRTFTIDVTPPPCAITRPANGTLTKDRSVLFEGTTQAGATVTLSQGQAGQAAINGKWSINQTLVDDGSGPLGGTTYDVTARAVDPAGNTGEACGPVQVTVDTKAPEAPVISSPAQGSWLTSKTVDVTGTSEPNARITIAALTSSNGESATSSAGVDGKWTVRGAAPEGALTLVAVATDAAGNDSAVSSSRSVSVDVTKPEILLDTDSPAVFTPASASATIEGTVTDNLSRSTLMVELAGTDGNPLLVTWEEDDIDPTKFAFSVPVGGLSSGVYTLTLTATDKAGNTPLDSVVQFVKIG